MTHRLAALAAVTLALTASACSSSTNRTATSTTAAPTSAPASAITSTTTTTTVASTTTAPTTTGVSTTSVATTTEPSTTAPPISAPPTTSSATEPPASTTPPTAVDDWKAVLEELSRRNVALYATPDLSRIGDYCAAESDCAQGLQTQLADAIAKGQHIEGQHPFTVLQVIQASVSNDEPKVATVLFTIGPTTPPAATLVDAAGNVVNTLSLTTTKTKGRFLLVEYPEDPALPWRLVHIDDLGPVP